MINRVLLIISLILASQALVKFPLTGHKVVDHERLLQLAVAQQNVTQTSALNYQTILYTINVTIGTPPVTFTLQLDTSQSWLWVGEPMLNSYFNVTYACSASSTCKIDPTIGDTIVHTYLGAFSGYLCNDTVTFAGLTLPSVPILVTNASALTGYKYPIQVDGGFGLQANMTNPYQGIMGALADAGMVDQEVFSLYLTFDGNGTDMGSQLVIGGYDTQYMIGNYIMYLPVIAPDDWGVGFVNAFVQNWTIPTQNNKNFFASTYYTFDSSIPVISLPPQDYINFLFLMNVADSRCSNVSTYCNCSQPSDVFSFPMLTFQMGDYNVYFEMLLQSYQYMTYNQARGQCLLAVVNDTSQDCDNNPYCYWTLGTPVMSSYYFIFDFGASQIGFVPSQQLGAAGSQYSYTTVLKSNFCIIIAMIFMYLFKHL
jgi:hypothetical protein